MSLLGKVFVMLISLTYSQIDFSIGPIILNFLFHRVQFRRDRSELLAIATITEANSRNCGNYPLPVEYESPSSYARVVVPIRQSFSRGNVSRYVIAAPTSPPTSPQMLMNCQHNHENWISPRFDRKLIGRGSLISRPRWELHPRGGILPCLSLEITFLYYSLPLTSSPFLRLTLQTLPPTDCLQNFDAKKYQYHSVTKND